jgi:hypothetical protein
MTSKNAEATIERVGPGSYMVWSDAAGRDLGEVWRTDHGWRAAAYDEGGHRSAARPLLPTRKAAVAWVLAEASA